MKREESHEEMTESFFSRDDHMYYRRVTFGKRIKKFGPQDANARPILVSNLSNVLFCFFFVFFQKFVLNYV